MTPRSRLRTSRSWLGGAADDEHFLRTGREHAATVRYAFDSNGRPFGGLGRFLDFGCGCGRVTRHLTGQGPAIVGCDYNKLLVNWCQEHLTDATFTVNELRPPTPYRDGQFDGIMAMSVMTHLTIDLQRAWLAEWRRILAPGGLLLFTAHGTRFRDKLDADQLRRFDAGEIVVLAAISEGSNRCASFHPPGSVEAQLLDGFELVRHFDTTVTPEDPEGWNYGQDGYLLRRVD